MSWRAALTLAQVADELGRSERWLASHWRQMVKDGRLPKPILSTHLVWSAAHVYAVLDRELTPAQRIAAAGYRAAAAAMRAAITNDTGAIAEHRARLEQQFTAKGKTDGTNVHRTKNAADI
jgi:hypothetical protein